MTLSQMIFSRHLAACHFFCMSRIMCDSADGDIYFSTADRTEMETSGKEGHELMARDHQLP